jgi:hypothetical protein
MKEEQRNDFTAGMAGHVITNPFGTQIDDA